MNQGGVDITDFVLKNSSFLVVAHEMKAPLAIVRQLSLALNDETLDFSVTEQKKMLAQIAKISEKSLRIMSDLTKVARLEDALFEMSPINSGKICDDILRETSTNFRLSGRQIRFKKPKKTDLVLANYDLLRSILLNFADNALVASSKKTTTEISVKTSQNRVRISVRDYGKSLPSEVWRAVKNGSLATPATHAGSSGLGIYIAKNFAEKMNAKIGVIRHRDGSTFYVDLLKSEQLSIYDF